MLTKMLYKKVSRQLWKVCSIWAAIFFILLYLTVGCADQEEAYEKAEKAFEEEGVGEQKTKPKKPEEIGPEEPDVTELDEGPAVEEVFPVYYIDYQNGNIPLSKVPIGSRLIDLSWEWEFRIGDNYSNKAGDIIKPVVWLVVAKDHYEGIESHVTIMTKDIIGAYTFDNSTNEEGYPWGHIHWGKSGTKDATFGLRPWLNSTGIHANEGFYRAFSSNFKKNILTTKVPNCELHNPDNYYTEDKVFIPSTTELGYTKHDFTCFLGKAYPLFSNANNEKRITSLRGIPRSYRTRSPVLNNDENLYNVTIDGDFTSYGTPTRYGSFGVRPALNLNADILVTEFENKVDVSIATVNTDYLRLRNGPGTDYEIIDRIMRDDKLKLLDSENEWFKVRTSENKEGWVYGDYLDMYTDFEEYLLNTSSAFAYPQPVGYTELGITNFIESFTSFSTLDYVLPEFEHPNEISNGDLISSMTLSALAPKHYNERGHFILGKEVQLAAELIFGPDIKRIEHGSVFPYYWVKDKEAYKIEGFGPSSYTKTKVINIKVKGQEFIADAVHLIYYYNSYDGIRESYVVDELSRFSDFASHEDLYEHAIQLVDEQQYDGTIDQYLDLFPVRRYVLSKEGDGILYIRQSYLVDD